MTLQTISGRGGQTIRKLLRATSSRACGLWIVSLEKLDWQLVMWAYADYQVGSRSSVFAEVAFVEPNLYNRLYIVASFYALANYRHLTKASRHCVVRGRS